MRASSALALVAVEVLEVVAMMSPRYAETRMTGALPAAGLGGTGAAVAAGWTDFPARPSAMARLISRIGWILEPSRSPRRAMTWRSIIRERVSTLSRTSLGSGQSASLRAAWKIDQSR